MTVSASHVPQVVQLGPSETFSLHDVSLCRERGSKSEYQAFLAMQDTTKASRVLNCGMRVGKSGRYGSQH